MSDPTTRLASCLCGGLTAATEGEPALVFTCSCSECRRKSGSVFGLSTYWPAGQVRIEGPHNRYRRIGEGRRGVEYLFCPTCGVAPCWRADFAPDMIGIAGGNFPDCSFARPTQAIWTEQCPAWVSAFDDIPKLPRQ